MLDNVVVYKDREQAAAGLAARVAEELRAALARKDRALLAVPGGSTPAGFLQALSRCDLDWSRVDVLPTDERWVPEDHPRSNAALLDRTLLIDEAGAARRLPLYADAADQEAGIARVERALIETLGPAPRPDVCVLGMGEDGHVASLFPGGDRLNEALDPDGRRLVLAMRAPGAAEPRVTLTLPLLAGAGSLHLLIFGDAKRSVLARAAEARPAEMPVRAVAEAASRPPSFHWAP